MAENEVNKLRAKDWAVMAIAISALIASLLLIIFPPFTLTLTGAGTFSADGSSWENKLVIPADSSTPTTITYIIFDQYKTANCADNIYVETSNNQQVSFSTENDIIIDGVCTETNVVLQTGGFHIPETNPITYNIYYGKITAPTETEPKEPATLEIAPESNFTTQAKITACADLSTDNEIYTLDRAIYGNQTDGSCINIKAENVTLDCANNNITGIYATTPDTYAIYIESYNNLTVKNCNITNYTFGIYAYDSDISNINYNNITGCAVGNGCKTGIWLESSINATISYNFIQKNYDPTSGVHLKYSNGTNIHHNTVFSNDVGMYLEYSSQNNVTLNNVSNNTFKGITLESYSTYNNITDNNVSFTFKISNKPGISLYGNSGYNSIERNNASYNGVGVYIFSDSNNNNTIINNIANNNALQGIAIYSSLNNTLTNNTANNNTKEGIYLSGSDNNTLTNITANNNLWGISLASSSNNTLTNITANNNYYDVPHDEGGIGIYLTASSNNNTLTNITANNNLEGIFLGASSNNILTNITVNSNYFSEDLGDGGYGISLGGSSNNNTFTNVTASNNLWGIYMAGSCNNNILTDITASDNHYNATADDGGCGIKIISSSNNNILTNITANSNTDIGIYIEFSSSNNTLTNITASNSPGNGVYFPSGDGVSFASSDNNTLTNITAKNNTGYGISFINSNNNNLTNSAIYNNTVWDFYSPSGSLNNTVTNFDISSAIISFTFKDISLRNGTSPGSDPSGYSNISKWINATNNSANSWLFLNVSYTHGDLGSVNESTLFIARNNGTWETDTSKFASSYGNDTTNNYVYANITNFSSIFAPLGASSLPINVSGCMNLTQANQLYVLNQSLSGNQSNGICIDIQADNVNLDCDNWNITGNASHLLEVMGIFAGGRNNVSITNCNVREYKYGYNINNSNNVNVTNSIAFNNSYYGVLLNRSSSNLVQNNTMELNNYGIDLYFAPGNTILDNNISAIADGGGVGTYGISVVASNNTDVEGNTIQNYSWGFESQNSDNNNVNNNTASLNTGIGFNFDDCDDNNITNNTAVLNKVYGMSIYGQRNNISGNNVSSNQNGIQMAFSGNNTLTNNTARSNIQWDFLSQVGSFDNTVTNLNIGSIISFTSKDIALKNGTSPGGEPLQNIGKYVNATNNSDDSWLFLNVSYADPGDLGNVNESTLRIAKNNASGWYTNPAAFANAYNVDPINNYVYANITNFGSMFVPLGASGPINVSGCMNLTQANQQYVLNQSISGNQSDGICIDIQIDNVTLDCQNNFMINGTYGLTTYGIYTNSSNTTIQNCYVQNYSYAISLNNQNLGGGGSHNIVNNNTVYNNTNGIHIWGSWYSNITNNNISTDNSGITNGYSENNTLVNNTIYNNTIGIELIGNGNNTLINNIANNNSGYGIELAYNTTKNYLTNNTFSNNIIDGIRIRQGPEHTANNNNIFFNNTASNNTNSDFNDSSGSLNNTVINLTTQQNIISFTYNSIALKGLTSAQAPSDPQGYTNISKYINATNNSANAWLFLNISYTAGDVAGLNESSLRIVKNNASGWFTNPSAFASSYGNDTTNNYVYANITNFGSMFVPLGEALVTPPTPAVIVPSGGGVGAPAYIYNCSIVEGQSATFDLRVGDSIDCLIRGKLHNIRLAEILDEQQLAEFEIASPFRIALATNQIYYADVDNSGLNDTAVKLLKFALPRNATIILSLLKEVAPVVTPPPAPPAPPTPPPAVVAAPPYALLGLIALLILILITAGYRYYMARPRIPRIRAAKVMPPITIPKLPRPPVRALAAPEVTPLQQKIVALRKELTEMKITELPAKPKARVIEEVKKIPKAKPKMPKPKPSAKPKKLKPSKMQQKMKKVSGKRVEKDIKFIAKVLKK
jgi:parallel beta-helix repeat protein